MLVVPVPSPASLNEVTSAPVLLLMLLSAKMKCGLSASAALAAITTVATAEMSTNAMRRIVNPPSGFPNSMVENCQAITPLGAPRRCRAVHSRGGTTGDDRPARGKWRGPSPAMLGFRLPIPPRGGHSATAQCGIWRQILTISTPGNQTARTNRGVTNSPCLLPGETVCPG